MTIWAARWASTAGWTRGGASVNPSISGDGRYVAFALLSDFHVTDLNQTRDIYEYDLATDTSALISQDDVYGPGNDWSDHPSLSSDGKYTAFESQATNFYLDTNAVQDTFVHTWMGDPVAGRVDSGGAGAEGETDQEPIPRHCSLGKPAASASQPNSQSSSVESAGTQPAFLLEEPRIFCRVRPVPPPPRRPIPPPPPVLPSCHLYLSGVGYVKPGGPLDGYDFWARASVLCTSRVPVITVTAQVGKQPWSSGVGTNNICRGESSCLAEDGPIFSRGRCDMVVGKAIVVGATLADPYKEHQVCAPEGAP